jgi:hypothetical protein
MFPQQKFRQDHVVSKEIVYYFRIP